MQTNVAFYSMGKHRGWEGEARQPTACTRGVYNIGTIEPLSTALKFCVFICVFECVYACVVASVCINVYARF